MSDEQNEAWGGAYGGLDLEAVWKKCGGWCLSNSHLSPKSRIGCFVNTWFAKGQNQASHRSIPVERATEVKVRLYGYCGRGSTGTVNGIPPCDEHSTDAMDMKPRRMLEVVAKPVAGRD